MRSELGLVAQNRFGTGTIVAAERLAVFEVFGPAYGQLDESLQGSKDDRAKVFGSRAVVRRILFARDILPPNVVLGERLDPSVAQIIQVSLQRTHRDAVSREDVRSEVKLIPEKLTGNFSSVAQALDQKWRHI